MQAQIINVQEFQVDLWFCYGSFFYGIESSLNSCTSDELFLSLQNNSEDEAKGFSNFLDMITEKPKGLLRVEIRIFLPETMLEKFNVAQPIFLYSDVVPKLINKTESSFALHISFVQPMSKSHGENWNRLLSQIVHYR